MAIQKCYIYKVYHAGTYIGNLPFVMNDYNFQQDINSAGSSITINVGVSPDTTSAALDYLQAQDSSIFTTEAGDPFTIQRQPDIVGNDNDQIMIRSGNELKIWEYSDYYPNGKLMFSGSIERWSTAFGGSTGEDATSMIAYPDAEDLQNYVIPGSNGLFVDQSQAVFDASATNASAIATLTNTAYIWPVQSFTIGAGITNLSAIEVILVPAVVPISLVMEIYANVNDTFDNSIVTPLASASFTLPADATFTLVHHTFSFATPTPVTSGATYCFVMKSLTLVTSFTGGNSAGLVDANTNNPYAAGSAYVAQKNNLSSRILTNWTCSDNVSQDDWYFKTYYSTLTTINTFSNYDPALIVENILGSYGGQGGAVTYTTPSIDLTGLSVTYTFQLATILEGIQAAAKLAPSDWYWYVDAGTNILYFKERHTTADFLLTKGVHINRLEIVASTENVKNILYFSGGDDPAHPGQQIFKQYSDSVSINKYKPKIDRESDNRVTLATTADILGASYLSSNKNEQYQTTIIIPDGTMDITLLRPGQIIGFRGFGSFVDRLLIQIVRIEYTPDSITLTLGQLPPRINVTLQQAVDDITSLQTIANPNSPS